ncbi:MAG: hypothetical protein ACI849_001551 [Patiriisocius sp.]|jgi:hypothetical protein
MKTRSPYTLMLLFIIALCSFPSEILAQNNSAPTFDFIIKVEIEDNKVNLKCTKGCNWKTLAISTDNASFDANGTQSSVASATDFMITVSKDDKGIVLKGLKGTDWTELSLGCKDITCRLVLNQRGLAQ